MQAISLFEYETINVKVHLIIREIIERNGVFIRNPTDYVIKHNKEKQKYLVHELFDFYGP